MDPTAEPEAVAKVPDRSEHDGFAVLAMLNGATPDVIRAELVARGVSAEEADAVVERALELERARWKGFGGATGKALEMLGSLVIALGVALMAGNRTGLYPTFPFAGLLGIGLGIGLMCLRGSKARDLPGPREDPLLPAP